MSKRRRILQARERERQAWSLTQRGRTQGEIATELGITQPSVSKILARLEQRVLGELAGSVQELELRQAARLEYLYREAVDAWESSKPLSAVDGSAAAERRAPGDRRFLAEARTVLADLRRLWGLDAPVKVEAPSTDRPLLMAMSDEELYGELAENPMVRSAVLATVTARD